MYYMHSAHGAREHNKHARRLARSPVFCTCGIHSHAGAVVQRADTVAGQAFDCLTGAVPIATFVPACVLQCFAEL